MMTTTIHTATQQQLHTRQRKTNNNKHETNKNFTTCTEGKNTQAREYSEDFEILLWIHSFKVLMLRSVYRHSVVC